ncbi:hypothetical protein YC2023_016733 [Brassica napus]
MKRKRSAYRGNSDGIPTEKASSSEFPRNFVKSPNGYNISSEFIGFFRGTHISSEFPRDIPTEWLFLGIPSGSRSYHFAHEKTIIHQRDDESSSSVHCRSEK